jgi:hypothetical protein
MLLRVQYEGRGGYEGHLQRNTHQQFQQLRKLCQQQQKRKKKKKERKAHKPMAHSVTSLAADQEIQGLIPACAKANQG